MLARQMQSRLANLQKVLTERVKSENPEKGDLDGVP